MRTLISALMLQFVIFALTGCNAFSMPEAKVIVKVMDEAGKPVPEADVTIYFQYEESIRGWETATVTNHAVGKSNPDGIFECTGTTDANVFAEARKQGYYRSDGISKIKPTRNPLLNHWDPWPLRLEVVLKKKRNPVPMYRKFEWLKPPVLGLSVGYDLEIGDWVTPHGKGTKADFFQSFHIQSVGDRNYYSCIITFPGQQEGLQKYTPTQDDHSWYKWPFEAMEDGYVNKFSGEVVYEKNGPEKSNSLKEKTNYLFRVRTKIGANGKIISACYGKMEFISLSSEGLNLIYFFNPDGTRNLEEDPKQNLFDLAKQAK